MFYNIFPFQQWKAAAKPAKQRKLQQQQQRQQPLTGAANIATRNPQSQQHEQQTNDAQQPTSN